MKNLLLLLLLLLSCSGLIISTSNCIAANLKVGVIDFEKIMKDSPQMRKSANELRQKFASDRNEIIAKQKALEKIMANFHRDNAVMNQKDKTAAQKQIAEKTQELNQAKQAYSSKLFTAQQTIVNKFIDQTKIIVNKIAKKNHLDMVLAKNVLLYVTDRLDITAQIENALSKSQKN